MQDDSNHKCYQIEAMEDHPVTMGHQEKGTNESKWGTSTWEGTRSGSAYDAK